MSKKKCTFVPKYREYAFGASRVVAMQYLVFDNMSCCTEADVERLLPLVSEERRAYALRYRHLLGRWTALKSYEMLMSLYPFSAAWSYNSYGKPFVPGAPCFSLSHCRHAVAVVVDECQVGIDVESIRTYNESLAHRVMNEQEMQYIEGRGEDKAVAFTELWTQKEAVLKLRGTGIVDDLRQVLVGAKERLTTYVYREKGYCLTIAQS